MTALASHAVRSQRKAKGSGHLRRAEILDAAQRIFVEYGYEGATIRKIAEVVGVSSTALYMHFRDKDEMLIEICEAEFAALLAQNTEISALRIDPVERVRKMLGAYMRFALANPNAYQLVLCSTLPGLNEARSAAIGELSGRCYDLFLGAVRAIGEAGRLRSGDADLAAQTSWAATHGLVALMITRPNFEWASAEALIENMLDSLFDGLAAAA